MSSEEHDELTEEQKDKIQRAGRTAQELLTHDRVVQAMAACLMAGYGTGNYAAGKLQNYLQHIVEKGNVLKHGDLTADLLFFQVTEVVRRESAQLSLEHVANILDNNVLPTMREDLKKIKQDAKEAQKEQAKLGMDTPWPTLQATRLQGRLRAGQVLVFQGEARATEAAIDALLRKGSETRMKFSRMVIDKPSVKDAAITVLPVEWWTGALSNHDRAKDVFSESAVGDGQVVLVDDMRRLGAGTSLSGGDIVTQLRKMAKRIRRPIVAQLPTEGVGALAFKNAHNMAVVVDVEFREHDGEEVLMVDGNLEVDSGDEDPTGSVS